ncbi:MAG: hypothetical protein AAF146_22385, partial [Bacteroidota bacterium]
QLAQLFLVVLGHRKGGTVGAIGPRNNCNHVYCSNFCGKDSQMKLKPTQLEYMRGNQVVFCIFRHQTIHSPTGKLP